MSASPYFTPTYFPSDYFSSYGSPATPVSGPTVPVASGSSYFPPSYFSPTYFSFYIPPQALSPSPPPPPPPPVPPATAAPPYGDRDAYAAILAALGATEAFASVQFGTPLDRMAMAGGGTPVATLLPGGWQEFDEVDPRSILRRVSFSLDMLVREDDPFTRFQRVGQAEAAAYTAIEGSGLGGCLPALTRLHAARYDPRSLPPEQAVRLEGEFTYLVDPTETP